MEDSPFNHTSLEVIALFYAYSLSVQLRLTSVRVVSSCAGLYITTLALYLVFGVSTSCT